MKLKSITRTANCAWSPEEVHSGIFLAAGTTAQQVDASFNTSSQLEILNLDVASSEKELKPVAQTACDLRFHKLVWGGLGIQQGTAPSGIICGGTDNGTVQLFSVQRLLDNEQCLLAAYRNHSGPVHALDLNPFQHNLLASGSRESEVFIWDLSSPSAQPYTPGTPCQPLEDVASLSWNRQVEHILAAAQTTRCVVWDLRKSEPIIRVGESSSRFRCKAVAWNPQVATQLCLASEDDHTPWLQIWDLRYASSPVKTLEKHRKGVLYLNWNPKDQDMLVSCGKDSSVCIWNPNGAQGAELISEIHTSSDWNFEVQWCPRNPGLVAAASFGGELAVYSVISGEQNGYGDMGLKKAPSWLSGGVGAQFGFGGKLITFSKESGSKVDVAQVVTDDELIVRVKEMDEILLKKSPHEDQSENRTAFWQKHFAGNDGKLWQFIHALFSSNAGPKLQELLGFSGEAENGCGDAAEDLSAAFDQTVRVNGVTGIGSSASADQISRALISGDVRRAAEICLRSRRFTEALFLADYAQDAALKENARKEFLNANRGDSMCRLVACVSSGLWEELVELAPIDEWQMTVAAVLGHVRADDQRAISLYGTVAGMLAGAGRLEEAMPVYLLARDLEKLAESYLSVRGKPDSNKKLQAFMEVMTAAKVVTGAAQLPKIVSNIVAEYVALLANQGCLSTTLYYLDDLDAQDVKVVELRDRILKSQGSDTLDRNAQHTQREQQQNAFSPQHQQHLYSMQGRSRSRTISSTSNFDSAPPPPALFQPSSAPTSGSISGYPTNAAHQPHQSGYPAYPDVNSNLPTGTGPASVLGTPQEMNPVSKDHGSGRPLSRAGGKYPAVVDPSIKNAGAGYGTYGNTYNPAPADSYAGYSPPGAAHLNKLYMNSRSVTPSADMYGGGPFPSGAGRSAFNRYATAPGVPAPAVPQSPPINLPCGNDYTRDERYSAPGWNDPPPLRRASKQLPSPPILADNTCPQPLTTPLPAVPAPGTDPAYFNTQQTTATPSFVQPQSQQTNYSAPQPPAPAAPVEKPPIPQQYQHLYQTFDRLRAACQGLQNNLVQKKMEDVSRKIESLGDKLRYAELSDTTILSLERIAEAVTNQNYAYALQIFAYLAQTSNLTETSIFLPGIKTLLAIAQQHQVYA